MPIPSLDHKPAEALGVWTGHLVKARLLEAYKIEHRMPSERRNGGGSNWPTIVHGWTDYVHWNNPGDDARARVWRSWEHSRGGADAVEISKMYEAFLWVQILTPHQDEMRSLMIWASVSAIGRPLRRELKKRKIAHATFYRAVTAGANRIANELNRRGARVR